MFPTHSLAERTLPERLALVLHRLVQTAAETLSEAGRRWFGELLERLQRDLYHRIDRFTALYNHWKAGTLRPLPPPAHRPATPRRRRTVSFDGPLPPLRWRHDWIMDIGGDVLGRRADLEQLLRNDPDLPAFLAAAPQAGRLLRPVCRLLRIDFPEALHPPPAPPPEAEQRVTVRPSHGPPPTPPTDPAVCGAPPFLPAPPGAASNEGSATR